MSASAPKTIVVVPTYNEAENLPLLAEALFNLAVDNLHLLVVDDNSPDGTGKMAEDLSPRYDNRIDVLHRTEKAGLGPAYIAGFAEALQRGADYIIQMDADFSHQPHYIPEMLALAPTHDFVIGSRYVPGGSVDESWSFLRKLLSWWANRLYVPTILQIPIRDATGGYRLWKRATLVGMDTTRRVRSSGYVFQVEMAYIACKLGYKHAEVAIHFPDRQRGTSKMDSKIALEASLRVWQIMARHRHLSTAMRHAEDLIPT